MFIRGKRTDNGDDSLNAEVYTTGVDIGTTRASYHEVDMTSAPHPPVTGGLVARPAFVRVAGIRDRYSLAVTVDHDTNTIWKRGRNDYRQFDLKHAVAYL